MDRTLIQWNVENWLTVVLMVAIAYAVVGIVVSFVTANLPSTSATADAG